MQQVSLVWGAVVCVSLCMLSVSHSAFMVRWFSLPVFLPQLSACLSHVYFHLSGLSSTWLHCQAGSRPWGQCACIWGICFVSLPLSPCVCGCLCWAVPESICLAKSAPPTQAHPPSIPTQTPTPSHTPHRTRTFCLTPLSLSPPSKQPAEVLWTEGGFVYPYMTRPPFQGFPRLLRAGRGTVTSFGAWTTLKFHLETRESEPGSPPNPAKISKTLKIHCPKSTGNPSGDPLKHLRPL